MLLITDPKKRIDYKGFIKHPWIVGNGINNKPIPKIKNNFLEF